jgi:sulfur carrier protein
MVTIVLNGESRRIADGLSVDALLATTQHAGRKVAVEINREIVPRSLHAQRILHDGDRVEIVQAMGGG